MRTVTIIIEATHNENSDAALAGALARFAAKNLNTLGYRVQDIVCSDKEYRLPEEPPKPEVDDAIPSVGEEAAPTQEEEAAAPPEGPKSKPLIDPADFTIPQLRGGVLDGYVRRQLTSLHKREMKDKARDGAIAAIKDAIDRL
jgi:hypothetical protein